MGLEIHDFMLKTSVFPCKTKQNRPNFPACGRRVTVITPLVSDPGKTRGGGGNNSNPPDPQNFPPAAGRENLIWMLKKRRRRKILKIASRNQIFSLGNDIFRGFLTRKHAKTPKFSGLRPIDLELLPPLVSDPGKTRGVITQGYGLMSGSRR